MASLPLDKQMNVIKANIGAETENISKCFRALLRSRPSCSRKVTRPKAAGALWSIIARKMIISTSNSLVAAAAPNAIPSAAAWTTKPSVVVQLTGPLPPLFLLWPEITMSELKKLLSNYVINTIWTLILLNERCCFFKIHNLNSKWVVKYTRDQNVCPEWPV